MEVAMGKSDAVILSLKQNKNIRKSSKSETFSILLCIYYYENSYHYYQKILIIFVLKNFNQIIIKNINFYKIIFELIIIYIKKSIIP
jgi:hypothetical protein